MVVSEKHGLVIIGVNHELFIYEIDPVTLLIRDPKKYKKISFESETVTKILVYL